MRQVTTQGVRAGNHSSTDLATGYSILVVEDEPLVCLDLADMLKAAGARVVSTKRQVKRSRPWTASKSPHPSSTSILAVTTVRRSVSVFGNATYRFSSMFPVRTYRTDLS
jgi:hypothetical protein